MTKRKKKKTDGELEESPEEKSPPRKLQRTRSRSLDKTKPSLGTDSASSKGECMTEMMEEMRDLFQDHLLELAGAETRWRDAKSKMLSMKMRLAMAVSSAAQLRGVHYPKGSRFACIARAVKSQAN